jgi:O-antigen/teichoic acid export membrane protein
VLSGPWAALALFNAARRPTALSVGLLGAATLLMMLALVVQPTLVAMGRQRLVTVAWVLGALVFLAVLVAPVAPIDAALAAQLAGPAVVLVVLAVGVLRVLGEPGNGRLTPNRTSVPAADTEGS